MLTCDFLQSQKARYFTTGDELNNMFPTDEYKKYFRVFINIV